MTRVSVDRDIAVRCARIALADCYRRRVKPDDQLLAHVRALFSFADEPESEGAQSSWSDDVIDSKQAAEILGCTPQHVGRIAEDLGGVLLGRQWVFSRRLVTQHARRLAC